MVGGAVAWTPMVVVGLSVLDATDAKSSFSSLDGLIEHELLCFSRFRTSTLTPH